ncbi:diguanylate cyclase (GGDEF) domain-containing protein [Marinobacter daqiaonensis]|uniref:diguanylate cyclase n=1 Tax=Marinobacter daqiaonensis TaxID=650891 RepID=A0A1I6IJC0_9GAMM|nr:GGDEF domain-containing protein [Marinobacter daqiaonensis]SFR66759.1 diguanylate cyclase (GGDEF) domain-containing protein [Marinobacter daqiaonensis]
MSAETIEQRIQRAQSLRLKRMLWGFANHGCTGLAVAGLYLGGFLPLAPVLVFFASSVLISTLMVLILQFGINLRFRDPSMTMAQITLPVIPSLYVMYFVALPQGRILFLLLATGGLLFGALALNRRQMFTIAWLFWLGYLVLVLILTWQAPDRVYWPLEAVTLFAYASVLSILAYLGSFISQLRSELSMRNRELKHANLELVELATRDPLTSLPNRRTVMEQFEKEVARSDRQTEGTKALGISVLDIDHFKKINDTFGHQAGDEILRKVSRTIEATIRRGDYVGRIGGEEFLLIFPDTAPDHAIPAAERIRRAVSALRFDELPESYRVTVSQGVAIHQPGETVENNFKRADEALYQAKNSGRNQVVMG